ncbi:MAG TPA: hypothetical protein VF625_13710, partial [Longimicrobium sp.]
VRIPRSPTGAPLPGAEARAVLAGALLVAAPRVTPAAGHPCAFWADARGMERLGGDAAVARALHAAAVEAGFPEARVGIAATCIAAAAATRERGTEVRVVPPGGDASYLARCPLAVVPALPAVRATLALLGITSCGALADLPPAEVELRMGVAGLRAWRLARADDPRWPFRAAPPEHALADLDFDPPLHGAEPLRFVVPGLVGQLVNQMAERGRIPAGLVITLMLETVDGIRRERRVARPARPTGDTRVLADLCRRAAESPPPGAPLIAIRLEAEREATERADQLDAFAPPAPDPGALHAALLPVFARWGDGALSAAVRHGAHLPGEHAAWAPRGSDGIARFTDEPAPAPTVATPSAGGLPLCLRRLPEPRPVRVREDGERRPAGVEPVAPMELGLRPSRAAFPHPMWKTFAAGPERISGAWWEGGNAREYWRVASADGWLGLLFRDAGSGGWFLEGWYD